MQGGRNAGKKNNRKYYSRLWYSLSLYGLDCPGNKIKTCLCVREVEMTLAILLPLERYDYLFATTGQQQEPDDRHMHREGVFILFQHYTEPANFLLREEALPFPSSVSLDAIARIAALGSVTVGLRAGHDNGENRGGSVGSYGRRVEGSEPFLHVSRRDIRDLVSPEPRQNLVAIVAPVDRECSGLPVATRTGKRLPRRPPRKGSLLERPDCQFWSRPALIALVPWLRSGLCRRHRRRHSRFAVLRVGCV